MPQSERTIGKEKLTLRKATLDDLGLLRGWDEKEHVKQSGIDGEEWQWEKELARNPFWREQLVIEVDGQPIGFVQIIDAKEEETRYWGDVEAGLLAIDIWIGEEDCLGKGYGTEAMRQALALCFVDAGVKAVLIDPLETNLKAHRFYRKCGFEFVGNRRFGDDDCSVFRLDRERWSRLAQGFPV